MWVRRSTYTENLYPVVNQNLPRQNRRKIIRGGSHQIMMQETKIIKIPTTDDSNNENIYGVSATLDPNDSKFMLIWLFDIKLFMRYLRNSISITC